ncbi:MAG: Lrp/AsnC ligand binding domain-containing protein [Candidatus Thorarchaeota archaeon]|nr:Lrp/AsnC ligand binding domain-containing protein [Candidatus Thorarchaeota archaeon]
MAVTAYMLMSIEIGRTEAVVERLRAIEPITKIAVTTGVYDIILRLEVPSLDDLYDITLKIHSIPGIKETSTAVVEKMFMSV